MQCSPNMMMIMMIDFIHIKHINSLVSVKADLQKRCDMTIIEKLTTYSNIYN